MQPNGDDDPRDLATDEPSGSRRSSGTQPVARVAAEDLPLVSVIVPVFNDPDGIRRCVAALHRQSYPSSRYEVIVVDNGSTDGTSQVVNGLGVRMVSENVERGSYAARNAGLRAAVGSVVAFTDADCIPSDRWLEEGVRVMQSERADLVGGRVRFALSTRPSGAEIWDSITNMQIEQNIRERQVAKTANLFVQRSVFDAIGAFPGDSRSGGDVAWTGTATRHGLALVFAEEAEVVHPARRLGPLLAKQLRVGIGQSRLGGSTGTSRATLVRRALRQLAPPSRGLVITQLASKHCRATGVQFVRVWMAAWLCRAATGAGALATVTRSTAARRPPG